MVHTLIIGKIKINEIINDLLHQTRSLLDQAALDHFYCQAASYSSICIIKFLNC